MNKTNNIIKTLLTVFVIVFTSTLVVYKFIGFEVATLYCISLSVAILSMAFAGLENIIINKKQ